MCSNKKNYGAQEVTWMCLYFEIVHAFYKLHARFIPILHTCFNKVCFPRMFSKLLMHFNKTGV